MILVNQTIVDRPVEMVYSFLRRMENIPLWNYYVVDVKRIKEGADELYRQQRREDEQVFEVLYEEPNKSIILATRPGSKIQFKRTIGFEVQGSHTLLTDRFEVDLGHLGLLQRVFKRRMQAAVKENLLKLKILLEEGEVALQDGRVMYANQ